MDELNEVLLLVNGEADQEEVEAARQVLIEASARVKIQLGKEGPLVALHQGVRWRGSVPIRILAARIKAELDNTKKPA